jgi:PAS domain S-box-containing protein
MHKSTDKSNQKIEHNNQTDSLKGTEKQLIASEIRYRRLFETAKDGILILDAVTGMIMDVNPFLIELLGYSKEQFMQKTIWEIGIFKDIIANYEKFIELQKDEYVRYEDLPLKTINQSIVHVEFVSNVYLVNDEKVIQCNIRDITQRKMTENELVEAKLRAEENDRLKTAFLHNISHEIRTPLNAIIGFSKFLNNSDLSQEKRAQYTTIIEQSGEQLLSIVTDIISIATIEAGQEKVVEKEIDIQTILNFAFDQFAEKAQLQNISFSIEPFKNKHVMSIVSDETKLNQILHNLISNAIKFTSQGHVRFGAKIIGKELGFFVEDTGIGIPTDMYNEIFERFRQIETTSVRQFGGSGLGLSISKAYVELLGGKIWLTSDINHGTTFFFTIPLKRANKEQGIHVQPSMSGAHNLSGSKTLLIADDDETNFKMLNEFLSGLNYTLIWVKNGLEAVEICKTNKTIDLVLMDIKMPEMDGYEASKLIKKFVPHLPIIAQTAYSSDMDKNKAFANGCSDFITKPLDLTLLSDKIFGQLSN